ncbi:MAG TPA: hypothetical protein VFJ82_14510 [Longimicrobium sp.]|nr:hypothetical protein [Longimicrobium sp.]
MKKLKIILAHGVLGFGKLPGVPAAATYFNGVAAHLGKAGHTIMAPQVNPFGQVKQRGTELGHFILGHVATNERAQVIAHSMGGLDIRYALSQVAGVAERVSAVVCIGTPHRGSPVADAIAHRTGPLVKQIPRLLIHQLERNAGALNDLTTEVCIARDAVMPDVPGIRYIDVAGDASRGSHELLLFRLAAAIGHITGEVNDGVVTRSSALRAGHQHLEDWPVDHGGEVGWSLASALPAEIHLPFLHPPRHLAWYDAILAAL